MPADVAEDHERIEDAYLSALADEAKADTEPALSTPEQDDRLRVLVVAVAHRREIYLDPR